MTVDAESRPRWKRLGILLAERRARIDPRYVTRKTFAAESSVGPAVLRDIENGTRDNYTPPVLAAVEAAYQLKLGAIRRFLDSKEIPFELEVEDTPPRGFETSGEWPILRVGGSNTATLAPAATLRRTPRWFSSEVARRGWNLEHLTIQQLRALAEHFRYSLAELLLNADLASDADLEIEERPALPPESEALADYDAAMERAISSPFLSRQEKKEMRELHARVREEAIQKIQGDV